MNSITEQNTKAYDARAIDWNQSIKGNVWYAYLEKPAMVKLMPQDLEHKAVLCIGVGAGDELSEIIKQNPRRLVAIDISEKLLEITKSKFASVETIKMDMMDLDFPDQSFDFVYSSLAFHYAPDWDKLMTGVNRVLKPGGQVLFSTHNPKFWATKTPTGNIAVNSRGIMLTEHTATLHAGVEVTYYNHPNEESILESVKNAGFEIMVAKVPEPTKPTTTLSKKDQEEYNNVVKRNVETPIFFVVLARKV